MIPLLSHDRFIFRSHFTLLYMHPTDYTFKLNDKNQASIGSKMMSPYQYWLYKGVKIFSLQFNYLRSSIVDLKTDEHDPTILSVAQKITHNQTYMKFRHYKKRKMTISPTATIVLVSL